jgi:hypothetical protein
MIANAINLSLKYGVSITDNLPSSFSSNSPGWNSSFNVKRGEFISAGSAPQKVRNLFGGGHVCSNDRAILAPRVAERAIHRDCRRINNLRICSPRNSPCNHLLDCHAIVRRWNNDN